MSIFFFMWFFKVTCIAKPVFTNAENYRVAVGTQTECTVEWK